MKLNWINGEGSVQSVLLVWQETLVPQSEPRDTEMVCTWQGENFKPCTQTNLRSGLLAVRSPLTDLLCPAGGDTRLFNSPQDADQLRSEEEETPSKMPPYSRLTWHTPTSRTEHPQTVKWRFQLMWAGITFTWRRPCADVSRSFHYKTLWTQISTL